jgi:hypothetical protein
LPGVSFAVLALPVGLLPLSVARVAIASAPERLMMGDPIGPERSMI